MKQVITAKRFCSSIASMRHKSVPKRSMEQLSSGTGNVIRQTEMLKELGAKTKKDLRKKSGLRSLAERSEEESLPEAASEGHDSLGEAPIQ